jgi:hypothetical protein
MSDKWQALIDDLHAEFDQGHMKVYGIVARHRAAIEQAAAREIIYGPIPHDRGLCQKSPCDCWCLACEAHNHYGHDFYSKGCPGCEAQLSEYPDGVR